MQANFHENYTEGEIKPPSERSTGLLFAALAGIVAVISPDRPTVLWVSLGTASILVMVSLSKPALLRPLNILWFHFGLFLHRVVNPIVMFAVFVIVFVPAGAFMRLWRDPLTSRRTTETSTYWLERKANRDTEGSMRNQF